VLVPRGDSIALAQLIAQVGRDGVLPPVLAATTDSSARLAVAPAIDIKPIEIVPLDSAPNPGT
jgi:hypothetical protein